MLGVILIRNSLGAKSVKFPLRRSTFKRFMILNYLIINSDLPSLTTLTTTDPSHHQGVYYLPWNHQERSSHFRSFIIHLWRKTALTTSKHLYLSPIVARNVFRTWKDLDFLRRVDPCWADLLHDVYSFIFKKKRKEMDSISILFPSSWFPFVYLIVKHRWVEISQK